MSSTVLIGQALTNLGPLTTTFTPPPACTVAVGASRGGLGGLIFGSGSNDLAYLGQSCSLGQAVDATSCWPSTSKGAQDKQGALHGWGYYSPGLHCPVGYATACSATGGSGGGSGWPVQFKLRDGETAVGCCPSGYGCANVNGQTCTMVATSTTIPTVTCDGSKSGDFAFQTIPDAQASITAFSLFAPLIQINWQSSDRPAWTSPTSTHTTAGAAITAAGTQTIDTGAASTGESLILDGNPQTTPTMSVKIGAGAGLPTTSTTASLQDGSNGNTSDSDGNGRDGFTPGAKVAVGVAGAVGFIMVIVCSLFYCWRRRMHRREEQEMDRLYGYGGGGAKHAMTAGGDFTSSRDIPGWYRGQRLATPAKDAVWDRGGRAGGGGGGGMGEVEMPESTYYRGYRR